MDTRQYHILDIINSRLKNLTIGQKLAISYFFVGTFTVGILFLVYYHSARTALLNRTFEQLSSVMNLKKSGIELYFEARKREMKLFCSLYSSRFAFSELNSAFVKYGTSHPNYLYADTLFGKTLDEYKLYNHFINVWLINLQGDVIFTANNTKYRGKNIFEKGVFSVEFSTLVHNLSSQPYLAEVSGIDTMIKKPFLLLFSPINDDFGQIMGYIMVKIDMKDIYFILSQRTGMGATGESYIVNKNYLMRSPSRFRDITDTSYIYVKTKGATSALQNITGKNIINDYRDILVLSAYTLINIDSLRWAILSEIDFEEAMIPIYEFRNRMIALSLAVLCIILMITFYLAKQISKPIKMLNNTVKLMSTGALPEEKLDVKNNDEIGQMIAAINLWVDGIKKTLVFAQEIGKNNLNVHFTPLSNDDILGHNLLDMRQKLVQLSDMVADQNKIKTLALIEGQENERKRISRDMHDGIGQMLTALKFKVQEIDQQNDVTSDIKNMLDDIIKEIRRITINLMPSVLWDFGLDAALHQLIKTVPVPVHYEYTTIPGAPELTMEERTALFRIAQEGLNNIAKYALATKVQLHIIHEQEYISMQISDNGIGFDMEDNIKHTGGLVNIRERAKLVNGELVIKSVAGKGTTIYTHIAFE
ncbi:MAG: histidine kinase [Cytophagales bacterium]|nr:histidine kinase [Cytophagales bacterium]